MPNFFESVLLQLRFTAFLFCLISSVCATPLFARSAAEPSDVTITIQDIVQTTEFSGIGVCKQAQLIAVRTSRPNIKSNNLEHRWLIIEWPSRKIVANADAGESVVQFLGAYQNFKPQWSSGCEYIYYRALRDGEMQVWALNVRSGEQHSVTKDDGNVLAFYLSQDEHSITYAADTPRQSIIDAEKQEYVQGALIDETLYNLTPLFNSLPLHGEWRAMRVRGLYPEHLLSEIPKSYKDLSLIDHSVRYASETESAVFADRESGVFGLYLEDYSTETSVHSEHFTAVATLKEALEESPAARKFALTIVSRADPNDVQQCRHHRCIAETIIPLSWSSDGSAIYFIAERGADWGANILSWEPGNDKVQVVFKSEGVLGSLDGIFSSRSLPCPMLNEIAFCTLATHDAPPQLMTIDLRSGEAQSLYDPNFELRRQFSLSTKLVHWTDKFERTHNGILVYPRNFSSGETYPLVITTYRCPGFLRGGAADGGPEYALAEHGFVVLCIDSNDEWPAYEITSKESIGPARYVAALAEYESAIDMLVANGLVDPKYVGSTGMSFSSQAVSFALTHSDIFSAVALTSIGVYEPSKEIFLVPDSKYGKALLADVKIGDDGYTPSEIYADISVTERADRVSAAVLVQSSDREYIGSLGVVTKLMAANKPVEMHVFPDETHAFHQPIHRYVNFTRNVDWFRFWLQDYEDPDPEKAEQYERWRKLRTLRDEDRATVN